LRKSSWNFWLYSSAKVLDKIDNGMKRKLLIAWEYCKYEIEETNSQENLKFALKLI
jgi:hypothetical protein